MLNSNAEAIYFLVISISIILLLILLPFILKYLKGNKTNRRKNSNQVETEADTEVNTKVDTEIGNQDKNQTKINDNESRIPLPSSTTPLEIEKSQHLGKEVQTESDSLSRVLFKTKENIFGRIKSLLQNSDEKIPLEEIEEILYTSDIGPQTVTKLMSKIDEDLSKSEKKDIDLIRNTLKTQILGIFQAVPTYKESADIEHHLNWSQNENPTVLMIVGVNGAGKTTTIGKLAAHFASLNKKIIVAAGDTFRAAAQNQLKVWTERAQVDIFAPEGVTDPSAVAFDAVMKAKAQKYDLVIIDTAGRLHTQVNLMEELKKVKRVIQKNISEAPHEVIIVLDANSGQNALIQAKEFHVALGLTGVVLTKMDGTGKGGVAIGISEELKIPIKIIGIGEKISDLKPFSSKEYVESLFD